MGGGHCSGPQLKNSKVVTRCALESRTWEPAVLWEPRVRPADACLLFTPANTVPLPISSPELGKTCNCTFFPRLSLKRAPLFEERPLALGVSR